MIGYHTLLEMNYFGDAFENSLIFYIPHSKTEIPDQFRSDIRQGAERPDFYALTTTTSQNGWLYGI
jgi:hypothetical protein